MMKVCFSVCLLVLVVLTVESAMMQAIAKLGESYQLDLGANNTVVKREYGDGTAPQLIHVGKDYWTNDKNEKFDEGNVHLLENGTLIFDKVKKQDYASYTLPDEPPHMVGEHAQVGGSMIVIRGE